MVEDFTRKNAGRGRPPLPNPEHTVETLFNADQAATFLDVSVPLVRKWFTEGQIQTYKLPDKPRRYTTLKAMAEWQAIRTKVGTARERANVDEHERRAQERRAAGRD